MKPSRERWGEKENWAEPVTSKTGETRLFSNGKRTSHHRQNSVGRISSLTAHSQLPVTYRSLPLTLNAELFLCIAVLCCVFCRLVLSSVVLSCVVLCRKPLEGNVREGEGGKTGMIFKQIIGCAYRT